MSTERRPIEETDLYALFDQVSDWAWDVTEGWDWFPKSVVGVQLITALDSVVANLVEGDGRYRPNDALHFFVIARASAREGRMWIIKAIRRGLVADLNGQAQIEKLDSASKHLNRLIQFRRSAAGTIVKETLGVYDSESAG